MDCAKRSSRSTVFRIVPKFKKEKVPKQKTTSPQPGRWPTLAGTVEPYGKTPHWSDVAKATKTTPH